MPCTLIKETAKGLTSPSFKEFLTTRYCAGPLGAVIVALRPSWFTAVPRTSPTAFGPFPFVAVALRQRAPEVVYNCGDTGTNSTYVPNTGFDYFAVIQLADKVGKINCWMELVFLVSILGSSQ